MPKIFRPIGSSKLAPELLKEKIKRDTEYELAVQRLYREQPSRTHAQAEKAKLWRAYEDWAKQSGLYEEITLEQQIEEAQITLNGQLEVINLLRAGAGLKPLEVV